MSDERAPVVYGSPWQIAVMLDSVARVLELEPTEVFADQAVRYFGHQLSGVIDRRVHEARSADNETHAQPEDATSTGPVEA